MIARATRCNGRTHSVAIGCHPVSRRTVRMGVEHKIKAAVSHAVQGRRLANPLPARLTAVAEFKGSAVLQLIFPSSLRGRIHVVHGGRLRVHRQKLAGGEDPARSPNLESLSALNRVEDCFCQLRMPSLNGWRTVRPPPLAEPVTNCGSKPWSPSLNHQGGDRIPAVHAAQSGKSVAGMDPRDARL